MKSWNHEPTGETGADMNRQKLIPQSNLLRRGGLGVSKPVSILFHSVSSISFSDPAIADGCICGLLYAGR
jgi:hypothetical protein